MRFERADVGAVQTIRARRDRHRVGTGLSVRAAGDEAPAADVGQAQPPVAADEFHQSRAGAVPVSIDGVAALETQIGRLLSGSVRHCATAAS